MSFNLNRLSARQPLTALITLLALLALAQSASAAITVSNSGNNFTVNGSSSAENIEVGRSGLGITYIGSTSTTVTDNTSLAMICVRYANRSMLACTHVGTPTFTVNGRDGDDEISTKSSVLNDVVDPVAIVSTVYGNGGNDVIITGDANDTVYGNDGEIDTVDCNGGADSFSGDAFDITTSC